MGDALDDYYDCMDRIDTYCREHDLWFEETGFGCPHCEIDREERAPSKDG